MVKVALVVSIIAFGGVPAHGLAWRIERWPKRTKTEIKNPLVFHF